MGWPIGYVGEEQEEHEEHVLMFFQKTNEM